jgi:hypothetical protein
MLKNTSNVVMTHMAIPVLLHYRGDLLPDPGVGRPVGAFVRRHLNAPTSGGGFRTHGCGAAGGGGHMPLWPKEGFKRPKRTSGRNSFDAHHITCHLHNFVNVSHTHKCTPMHSTSHNMSLTCHLHNFVNVSHTQCIARHITCHLHNFVNVSHTHKHKQSKLTNTITHTNTNREN